MEAGRTLETDGDTEPLMHYTDMYGAEEVIKKLSGTYSAIFLDAGKKTACVFRDRHGTRPLTIGKKDGRYIAASESESLRKSDAKIIEELSPGSVAVMTDDGMEIKKLVEPDIKLCHFEHIYLLDPEAVFGRKLSSSVREKGGRILYRSHSGALRDLGFFEDGTLLTFIPTCPYDAAQGFSKESGIPVSQLFYKMRDERAFIQLDPALREQSIRTNLYFNSKYDIRGRKVIVIDDSLIRGTNSRVAVKILKDKGASDVALLVEEPMVGGTLSDGRKLGCRRGVAMPSDDAFAASIHGRDPYKIGKSIGVDYMGFMDVNGLVEAEEIPADKLCMECIGGPLFD